MELVIVTGLSGAGKSTAMDALEDLGFYCVDNIPPKFIGNIAQLSTEKELVSQKVAIGIDVRGGVVFDELWENLDKVKERGIPFRLLFLDAATEVLITRYKQTRRRHPLLQVYNISFEEIFDKERELLKKAKEIADYNIDTTFLTGRQLKEQVSSIFQGENFKNMLVEFVSFGFKYGSPQGADLVFDVRCLPNPFYNTELKSLTGLDQPVKEFVFSSKETHQLVDKLVDLIDFLLPLYLKEGKSQLEIAIGCTGGKHRSVAVAEEIARRIDGTKGEVYLLHRDKDK